MRMTMNARSAGRLLLPALLACLSLTHAAWAQAARDDLGDLRADEARRQTDHVAVRLLGRVQNVREQGRRFLVETGGMRFQVEYDRTGLAGFGVRLPELRDGDRVIVYGRLAASDRVLSDRIVLVGSGQETADPRRVTGVVRTVDARRNRFTARDTDGGLVEVEYSDRTVLARLGRRATPDDLRVGDNIWAEGRWEGRGTLVASRVEITGAASNGWRDGEIGRVESISARDSSFQARFGRESRRVDATGAGFWIGSRRVAGGTLRTGMRVRVQGDERGSTIRATRIVILGDTQQDDNEDQTTRLSGRIRQVDNSARVIMLTPDAGVASFTRVYVTGNATVERYGRRTELRELQTGDRVRVRGSERDGRFYAEFVEVVR